MKPKNENPLYSRFLVTSPAGLAIITHPSTGFLKHPQYLKNVGFCGGSRVCGVFASLSGSAVRDEVPGHWFSESLHAFLSGKPLKHHQADPSR